MSTSFADTETIRDAIFDAIDGGFKRGPWVFDPNDESDDQSEQRHAFANAVISMIEDLQTAPFNHVKLQDLCDRHKRLALPSPTHGTVQVCVQCSAEQQAKGQGA